eukprot:661124-Lingulodinium_polyedra.AAC.1
MEAGPWRFDVHAAFGAARGQSPKQICPFAVGAFHQEPAEQHLRRLPFQGKFGAVGRAAAM